MRWSESHGDSVGEEEEITALVWADGGRRRSEGGYGVALS